MRVSARLRVFLSELMILNIMRMLIMMMMTNINIIYDFTAPFNAFRRD